MENDIDATDYDLQDATFDLSMEISRLRSLLQEWLNKGRSADLVRRTREAIKGERRKKPPKEAKEE